MTTTSVNYLINQVQGLQRSLCCVEQRLADASAAISALQAKVPDSDPPSTGTTLVGSVDGVLQYIPICVVLSAGYLCDSYSYGSEEALS